VAALRQGAPGLDVLAPPLIAYGEMTLIRHEFLSRMIRVYKAKQTVMQLAVGF